MQFSSNGKINFDYIYNNKELKSKLYLPSSDTFVFAEALEDDVEAISPNVNMVLEMG